MDPPRGKRQHAAVLEADHTDAPYRRDLAVHYRWLGLGGWWAGYAARVGLLAVVYVGAAKVGLSVARVGEPVTAVWPPTGIALAALLLYGYQAWPGITLGAFLANAAFGVPLAVSAGIALGNTLEALAGAWMLRQVGFDPRLGRVRDVLGLVALAAGLSTAVSATVGTTALCAGGVKPWAASADVWHLWWLGDAVGDLVVAPLLLTWGPWRLNGRAPRRLAEASALVLGLVGVSLVVFTWPPDRFVPPLPYLVFPFTIWAALRFGQAAATQVTFLASSIAIWGAVQGLGPWGPPRVHESLVLVQVFMGVVAVTTLVVAAVTVESQAAKEAARRSRDELQVILEGARVGTWDWDIHTGEVRWSDNLEAIHGLAPGTFGGTFDAFLAHVHPEDRETVLKAIGRAVEGSEEYEVEYRCVSPDGPLRWLAGRGRMTCDPDGRPLRMNGTCLEVTPRKHAEESLQQSFDLLHAVIEGTTDAVFVKDRRGRYLMINTAGATFLGRSVADVIGKDDTELFSPETAQAIMEGDRLVLATGEVQTLEDVGTAAGVTRTYLATKAPYRDARGAVVGVIGISRDITERKRAEEAHSRLAAIVESSTDAMLSLDREGLILTWGRGAEAMFGYPASEAVGRPFSLLLPPERAEEAAAALEQFPRGGRVENFETAGSRKDGTRIDVSLNVSPIRGAHGQVVGASVIGRDITARNRSERRLAAVHAVTHTLAGAPDLQQAVGPLMQTVAAAFHCDLGVFWKMDAASESLLCGEVWHAPGGDEAPDFELFSRQISLARREGLPGRAWETGGPVWAPDAPFPRSVAARRKGPCGALAFPLRSGSRLLGVLEFFSPDFRQPDEDLFRLVAGLTGQIAQFIDRRQAEAELHAREREFSLARAIQQGLLPSSPPVLAGLQIAGASQPAQETGGDYFDFIPMPDGQWVVAIGDASGHGIGAALLIAETRAYVRAFAQTHPGPGQVLECANQRLVEDITSDYFVTLFLARLDPATGALAYSGAGHLPGYVLDGRGDVKMALRSTGLPLGLSPESAYPLGPPALLGPGDLVVLLSDGVLEARPGHGPWFGINSALEVVRAHRHEPPGEVVAALLREATAWSQGAPADDMTAVVIKSGA